MNKRLALGLVVWTLTVAGLELGRRGLSDQQIEAGTRAMEAFELGRAERFFRRAVWLRPERSDFRLRLAGCRAARGDMKGAGALLPDLDAEGLSFGQAVELRLLASDVDLASGRGQAAVAGFEEALELLAGAEKIPDRQQRVMEIRALRGLSRALEQELGRPAEAEKRLLEALELARESELEVEVAQVQLRLAAWARGRRRAVGWRVETLLRPALATFEASGHRIGRAAALMALARVAREKEDLQGQTKLLTQAAAAYEGTGHLLGPALLEYDLANRDASVERYAEAHGRFLSARRQFSALGQHSGLRVSDMGLAWLQVRTGQLKEAGQVIDELLPTLGPNAHRRYLLWLSGHVALHSGDAQSALDAYREVLDLDQALGVEDSGRLSDVLTMVGQAGLQLGDLDAADKALARARRIAGAGGEINALVVALLSSADLEAQHLLGAGPKKVLEGEAQKYAERSVSFLEAAIELLAVNLESTLSPFHFTHFQQSSERLRSLLLEWHLPTSTKARAHAALFRSLELMRHRRQEEIRPALARPAAEGIKPAETEALLDLVARLGLQDTEEGSAQALRLAYRRYRQSVLDAGIGNDPQVERTTAFSQAIGPGHPASISSLQSALDDRTAVVFYAFGAQKAFALLVGREAEIAVALPMDVEGLEDRVRLLVDLLVARVSSGPGSTRTGLAAEAWRSVSEDLYQSLIAPLHRAGLGRGMNLGIVPIGALNGLPFAALIDENGEFLVENHLMWTAPSAAALLVSSQDDHPDRRSSKKPLRSMVAFGVDRGVEGPELSWAAEEAREVAHAVGGLSLVSRAATESALRQHWPARLLHIAAHGEIEPDLPLLSRLVLSASHGAQEDLRTSPGEGSERAQDPERDGRLLLSEILALRGESELVVLSSCRASASFSSRHRDWASGRLGLAGAFVTAGAHQVISSQLPIADGEARILMSDLYRELARHPPAVALNLVQRRHAREQGMAWIGFGLMGKLPKRDADPFLSVGEE